MNDPIVFTKDFINRPVIRVIKKEQVNNKSVKDKGKQKEFEIEGKAKETMNKKYK